MSRGLVVVERLFLAVPWGCLRFVIVVFPDHTDFLFLKGPQNTDCHSEAGGGGITVLHIALLFLEVI